MNTLSNADAKVLEASPALYEACAAILAWLINAEKELGAPLPVKYAARVQKPVVVEKLRAAMEQAGFSFLENEG